MTVDIRGYITRFSNSWLHRILNKNLKFENNFPTIWLLKTIATRSLQRLTKKDTIYNTQSEISDYSKYTNEQAQHDKK